MSSKQELREHEDYRWSYMNHRQLEARLRAIRNPIKLECFIELARRNGATTLYDLALRKAVDMGLVVDSRLREDTVVLRRGVPIERPGESAIAETSSRSEVSETSSRSGTAKTESSATKKPKPKSKKPKSIYSRKLRMRRKK